MCIDGTYQVVSVKLIRGTTLVQRWVDRTCIRSFFSLSHKLFFARLEPAPANWKGTVSFTCM
jgi:hypothetical protein